ncbi:hypothetical protein [Mesorhizobium sp.]|uniref:hypothetical protein n=1 Tax=Mesorhizobium sp. TaxID=1871066 RepID=UPI00121C803F|nr:hypothetical protein [Mesorhizobium sp.]TIL43419.1 MAG: hypothetical protein E5Y86_22505 [Mesorhizobium sp.]
MSDPLATLLEELEAARNLEGDEIENLQRTVALHALDAAHRYFAAIGVEDRLRAPFLHLMGAIQDIEHRRTNPMLSPGPFHEADSQHRTRQLDTAEFVMASYAVTLMSEQPKVSTDKALEEMAAAIGTDKKTLREFRKNLGRGRATEAAMRELGEWRVVRRNYKEMPVTDFVAIMKDKAKRLHLQKG